jgi:hypothetical protein
MDHNKYSLQKVPAGRHTEVRSGECKVQENLVLPWNDAPWENIQPSYLGLKWLCMGNDTILVKPHNYEGQKMFSPTSIMYNILCWWLLPNSMLF